MNTSLRKGIPENAALVFKGVIFEVWQWQQEMFDGTIQTFEKIWRQPTIEVIATVDDKIIIAEQDQPDRKNSITLIGGRAEEDEEPLETAKREFLEETGYQSDDWSLLLQHGKDGKVIHEMYYFIAKNCKKTQEPNLDAGEKIQLKFVSFDDFIKLTEEQRFWVSPEFIIYLLKLQSNELNKEKFRKLLF